MTHLLSEESRDGLRLRQFRTTFNLKHGHLPPPARLLHLAPRFASDLFQLQ